MAAGITPQSGLLEINGRLKVNEAINPNDVLTRNSLGKKSEKSFFANQAINTISGTTPIVVAIDDTDAYDITTGLPKGKVFDNFTDKIIGIATIDVADQNIGLAITTGLITTNLDSTGQSINDTVYADPTNGQLTLSITDKPIGYLLTIGANAKIYVSLAEASGGSGQLDIDNYIIDGVASTGDILTFVAYDDAAAVPVNGIGGSPTITFTKNTVNALRTGGDWLITKTAANSQGQGIAYEFTIEEGDKNKVFDITFNLKTSANYVTGDMGVYIYDVDNSVIINTNNVNIAQGQGKYLGKFFATGALNYRLLFHIQTTNANAYTVQLDNIRAEQEKRVTSFAGSDWIAFPSVAAGTLITATTTSPTYGTVAQNVAYWRRVGDSMEIIWDYRQTTAGSNGVGKYLFNLPPGFTIDTSRLAVNTVTPTSSVGKMTMVTGLTSEYAFADAYVYSNTQLWVFGAYSNNASGNTLFTWGSGGFGFPGTTTSYHLKATVPISGWSSNINLIQSQTEFAYNTDTSTSVDDTTDFGYGPEGVNIVAISKPSGIVKKRVRFRTPIQITDKIEVEVNNGAGWQSLPYAELAGANGLIKQFSGDEFDDVTPRYSGLGYQIVNSTDVDVVFGGETAGFSRLGQFTAWGNVTSFKWRVRKSTGSAVGEVAPFVGAKYNTTVSAASSSSAPVQWSNKEYDTHNAVTTGAVWKFTAPIAGYYNISGVFQTSGVQQWSTLYKNGIVKMNGAEHETSKWVGFNYYEYLARGEYVDVRAGSPGAVSADIKFWIAISKIG